MKVKRIHHNKVAQTTNKKLEYASIINIRRINSVYQFFSHNNFKYIIIIRLHLCMYTYILISPKTVTTLIITYNS